MYVLMSTLSGVCFCAHNEQVLVSLKGRENANDEVGNLGSH